MFDLLIDLLLFCVRLLGGFVCLVKLLLFALFDSLFCLVSMFVCFVLCAFMLLLVVCLSVCF